MSVFDMPKIESDHMFCKEKVEMHFVFNLTHNCELCYETFLETVEH